MSKQIISSGAIANDRTGDNLRNTAGKINANFNELYSALGNGSQLSVATVAKTGNYQDLTNKPALFSGNYNDLTNKPTIPTGVDFGNVTEHILPATDVTYDLGSATKRFRDLYLSGNTINLGGSTISQIGGAIVFDTLPGVQTDTLDVTGWEDYDNNVTIAIGQSYNIKTAGYNIGPYLDGAVPSIRYAFGNEPATPATWTFTYDGSGFIETITLTSAGDPIQLTDQFEFLWYPAPTTAVTPQLTFPPAASGPITNTVTVWNANGKELYINKNANDDIVSVTGTGWTGADYVPGGSDDGRLAVLKLPDDSIIFDGTPNAVASIVIGAVEDCFALASFIVTTQPHVAPLSGGGNANTGDVTFELNKIIGAGSASGDGNGYATVELVPDQSLYANHQYLVIDPTAPSHIHIRAGGPQDNSNADLILGGEKNHVRVRDNQGVRIQNEFTSDDYHWYDSSTFSDASWFVENGNNYVQFTTADPIMVNRFWSFTNGTPNQLIIYDAISQTSFTLDYAGWGSNPEPNVYKVQVVQTPPEGGTVIPSAIEFHLFTTTTNSIQLENNDFRVDVGDDIRMFSRDIFRLANYSTDEPIEITTDYDNSSYTWAFNSDGTMRFPSLNIDLHNGGVQNAQVLQFGDQYQQAVITGPTPNTDENAQRLIIQGQRGHGNGEGGDVYLWGGDSDSNGGDIKIYAGDADAVPGNGGYVNIAGGNGYADGGNVTLSAGDSALQGGDVVITSGSASQGTAGLITLNAGGATQWTFNADGSLSFPGGTSIKTSYGGGSRLIIDGTQGDGYLQLDSSSAVLVGYNSNGNVSIGNPNGGTITELVSEKVSFVNQSVPTTSAGKPGDTPGLVAFDSSYMYYCTGTFGGTTYTVVHNLAQGFSANGVDNGYLVENTYQLPQVGWKVYYNGEVRTINQVNNGGIPGFYVVFVDSELAIPGQASFAWGPAAITNIWKRVAWSGDTW